MMRAIALVLALVVGPSQAYNIKLGAGGTKVAVSYVGPGDINGPAFAWVGLRGFSAAYSTGVNPAVDLVDQAGANPITINIKSNGDLDAAAIASWVSAHSVTTIKVTKLYDQSGNSRHQIQATLANMPTLVLSPSGIGAGKYGLFFNGGQAMSTATNFFSTPLNTPFSLSIVGERISTAGSVWIWYDDNDGNQVLASGGNWNFGASTQISAPAADGAFHSAQVVYNTSTSTALIDSTGTSGTTSALVANGHFIIGAYNSGVSNPLTGYIQEFGWWSADKSANNTTMATNQHVYWGF